MLLFSLSVLSDSCDPMDCSPPGSSVRGILQARILEWVAIPSCRGSSWPMDWTHVSCTGRKMLYPWANWEAPIQPLRRKKTAGDAGGPPSLVPWIVWAPQEGPQHLHPPGRVSPAPAPLLLLLLPLLFGAQQSCWSRLNCFVGKQVSPLGVPVWPPQPALPALASPILMVKVLPLPEASVYGAGPPQSTFSVFLISWPISTT